MIITDLSQIFLAPIFLDSAAKSCAQNPSDASRDSMLHFTLNSLRASTVMHKKTYGSKMVVACDGRSWRNDVFPNYKWSRKQKRAADTSGIDWKFVFETQTYVRAVLEEYFPYTVIDLPTAEADDIVGALCKYISEEECISENMFGDQDPEQILIVSSDKDHYQLHRYKNVKQWSPQMKKLVKPPVSPRVALLEKIVAGEISDGVPSIKCCDDWFKNYIKGQTRAPVISKKYLQTFYDAKNPIDACLNDEERRNFQRNEQLVSYEHTPKEIYIDSVSAYNQGKEKKTDKMKLMNFFVKNKMNVMLSKIGDFF